MSERNGTANLLAQVTAFRELKEDYDSEVAEQLTAKNLQRNGTNATPSEVKAWDKINNAALQGNLDIPMEVTIAERKAAIAAGTTLIQENTTSLNHKEQIVNQSEDDLEENDNDVANDELPSIDEMYGYDNSEDNDEAALDDILKIQENS